MIVGFVYISLPNYSLKWTVREPFVDCIFVDPLFQRKGYGRLKFSVQCLICNNKTTLSPALTLALTGTW